MGSTMKPQKLDSHELDRGQRKSIVDAVDRLVDPLDKILALLQSSVRVGGLVLGFMLILAAAHFHAIWKLSSLEERVSTLIKKAEEVKEDTSAAKATGEDTNMKLTKAEALIDTQPQVTFQPSIDPSGKPSTLIVINSRRSSAKNIDKVDASLVAVSTATLAFPLPSSVHVVDGGSIESEPSK